MKCPNCGAEYQEGAAECLSCGIFFAKWFAKKNQEAGAPAAAPAPVVRPPSGSSSPMSKLIVWVILLGLGGWGYQHFSGSKKKAEKAEPAAEQQQEAAAAQPREEPAAPSPAQVPPDRQPWVEPLLAEINSMHQDLGVALEPKDLKWTIENAYNKLHHSHLYYSLEELGLSRPERQPFDPSEKKKLPKTAGGSFPKAKCMSNGSWVYLEKPPSTDQGYSECWRRGFGNKDTGAGVMFINTWLDYWLRLQWQPGFRRWDDFPESDAVRGYRHMLRTKLGHEKQNEELQKFIAKKASLAKGSNDARYGLLSAYETRIQHEAIRYKLDHLGM